MHLSEQDAALYYELMWALQLHLKQTLNLFLEVQTIEDYADLPVESKVKVREALYGDPTFIDRFVQENPQQFSDEKLAIALNSRIQFVLLPIQALIWESGEPQVDDS